MPTGGGPASINRAENVPQRCSWVNGTEAFSQLRFLIHGDSSSCQLNKLTSTPLLSTAVYLSSVSTQGLENKGVKSPTLDHLEIDLQKGTQRTLKIIQAVVMDLGCLPHRESKSLLLKTPH